MGYENEILSGYELICEQKRREMKEEREEEARAISPVLVYTDFCVPYF